MRKLEGSEIFRGGSQNSRRKRQADTKIVLDESLKSESTKVLTRRVFIGREHPDFGAGLGLSFVGSPKAGGPNYEGGNSDVIYFVPIGQFGAIIAEMYAVDPSATLEAFARAVLAKGIENE